MKAVPTPWEVMKELAKNITKAYEQKSEKGIGSIQFYFTHKDEKFSWYLTANGTDLQLFEGEADQTVVTLRSSFYDWLDLAGKKLHPIVGVIRGKLKFSGDKSFFSKVMPDANFLTSAEANAVTDPPSPFELNPTKHWKKPKRILVLNGSPRAAKGYTDFYVKAFLAGLEKAGASVEFIYLRKQKINPCIGCWQCWLSGTGDCIYKGKDDFDTINEVYNQADLIVYAFPLYVDGMPALLKNYCDRAVCRSHPFMVNGIGKTRHPRRDRIDQSIVVFSVCGFLEMENFDAVKAHFRQISHNYHLPIVAEIFRTACIYLYGHPILYRQLNSVLDALTQAGIEVAESGAVNCKTQKRIEQKLSDTSAFQQEANYFWNDKIKNGDTDF
jgi:multimeric flavodoxin WrbA/putative sterol carrier protein